MRIIQRLFVVFVTLATLSSCMGRLQPIHNVSNHPIPLTAQNLPTATIERVILQAGINRGWVMDPVGTGKIHGTLNYKTHFAEVDITYNQSVYSIRYVSSANLLANGYQIHRNYNRWIAYLEKDIDTDLQTVALGIRP